MIVLTGWWVVGFGLLCGSGVMVSLAWFTLATGWLLAVWVGGFACALSLASLLWLLVVCLWGVVRIDWWVFLIVLFY